jgi:pimeloyl-ACP methyl ester carboxylesterase
MPCSRSLGFVSLMHFALESQGTAVPHSTLVEFANLGHAPQVENPARFHEAVLDGLSRR